jgi:hypothetical protein
MFSFHGRLHAQGCREDKVGEKGKKWKSRRSTNAMKFVRCRCRWSISTMRRLGVCPWLAPFVWMMRLQSEFPPVASNPRIPCSGPVAPADSPAWPRCRIGGAQPHFPDWLRTRSPQPNWTRKARASQFKLVAWLPDFSMFLPPCIQRQD